MNQDTEGPAMISFLLLFCGAITKNMFVSIQQILLLFDLTVLLLLRFNREELIIVSIRQIYYLNYWRYCSHCNHEELIFVVIHQIYGVKLLLLFIFLCINREELIFVSILQIYRSKLLLWLLRCKSRRTHSCIRSEDLLFETITFIRYFVVLPSIYSQHFTYNL